MKISAGIQIVANETYNYDLSITPKEYAQYLQKIRNDHKKELVLKKVNTFMKSKWF